MYSSWAQWHAETPVLLSGKPELPKVFRIRDTTSDVLGEEAFEDKLAKPRAAAPFPLQQPHLVDWPGCFSSGKAIIPSCPREGQKKEAVHQLVSLSCLP